MSRLEPGTSCLPLAAVVGLLAVVLVLAGVAIGLFAMFDKTA
jgi:hypothetical protein